MCLLFDETIRKIFFFVYSYIFAEFSQALIFFKNVKISSFSEHFCESCKENGKTNRKIPTQVQNIFRKKIPYKM